MKKLPPYMVLTLYLLVINQISCTNNNKQINYDIINDSISLCIKKSRIKSINKTEKEYLLSVAFNSIKRKQIDSFTTKQLIDVAYQYIKLKDSTNFYHINNYAYELSIELKDTFALANLHWNYANFYNDNESYVKAYFNYKKAFEYFKKKKQTYYEGKMLYGMAHIKAHFEDFIGSEELIVNAISRYKPLKKNKSLYASYNYLALVQKYLGEYDKSLFYYRKSLHYLEMVENKRTFTESSLNNLGLLYFSKRDYKKSISCYQEALENKELIKNNPKLFAKLIDNNAYSKIFINDTLNVKHDLYQSLLIRNNLNHKSGIIINKLHLAEYYVYTQDTLKAIKYASEAKITAKQIKNFRDYLHSLKFLSNIDKNRAEVHLKEYIIVKDSLLSINRFTQNKFARIDFETDEYINEAKRLSEQKIWLIITSLSILLILILILFLRIQKSKNERLLFTTDIQKSNEQLYLMTIRQQSRLEKEKSNERVRISKELHDNVLGKLFGVRMGLGFLNIEGSKETNINYNDYLKELQTIEQDIRNVSHVLNASLPTEVSFIFLLEKLIEKNSKIANLSFDLTIDDRINWRHIDEIIKMNLFRVIQEVMLNIIKHAKAKSIIVSFTLENKNLVLFIKDDGIGFNVAKKNKGIGLNNIKSRIKSIKGEINIVSVIKVGTSMSISIPLNIKK